MKTTLLLGIACALLLVTGCVTNQSAPKNKYRPPATTESPSANLLVISAVYGSGIHYADVTYRINDLLHQPKVGFFARPEWLHADPTPGWNKALVIVYEYNGQRRIFTAGEGGRVNIDILLEAKKAEPTPKQKRNEEPNL